MVLFAKIISQELFSNKAPKFGRLVNMPLKQITKAFLNILRKKTLGKTQQKKNSQEYKPMFGFYLDI